MNLDIVKMLWEILVLNAISEEESDIFFNFLTSIMYGARNGIETSIINEETIKHIFFEILLKINLQSYRLNTFYALENFFLFINHDNKLIQSNI